MTRIPLRLLAPSALLAGVGFLPCATAHSHLAYIIINGELYHGFDPRPGIVNQPDRVAWSSTNTEDNFVGPVNYTTPDIICHLDGASTPAHAPVRAGDKIHVQWNGWPQSHVGPILSYLAPCEGTSDGCGSVDKTKLGWTKIDNSDTVMVDQPRQWSTDVMISNNNSWTVHVPSGLAPGPYVLRHETIALHFAKDLDMAQNYPLCMNLWVEAPAPASARGGTQTLPFTLDGIPATAFYKPTDPGILIDVFQTPLTTYVVPGPTVAANAQPVPHSLQRQSVPVKDGTPVRVQGTRTVPFVAKRTQVFSV